MARRYVFFASMRNAPGGKPGDARNALRNIMIIQFLIGHSIRWNWIEFSEKLFWRVTWSLSPVHLPKPSTTILSSWRVKLVHPLMRFQEASSIVFLIHTSLGRDNWMSTKKLKTKSTRKYQKNNSSATMTSATRLASNNFKNNKKISTSKKRKISSTPSIKSTSLLWGMGRPSWT